MGHISGVFSRKQERPQSQQKKEGVSKHQLSEMMQQGDSSQHEEVFSKASARPDPTDGMGLVWCHVGLAWVKLCLV